MTQYGAEGAPREAFKSSLRTSKSNGQPRVIASGDYVAERTTLDEAKETAETKGELEL